MGTVQQTSPHPAPDGGRRGPHGSVTGWDAEPPSMVPPSSALSPWITLHNSQMTLGRPGWRDYHSQTQQVTDSRFMSAMAKVRAVGTVEKIDSYFQKYQMGHCQANPVMSHHTPPPGSTIPILRTDAQDSGIEDYVDSTPSSMQSGQQYAKSVLSEQELMVYKHALLCAQFPVLGSRASRSRGSSFTSPTSPSAYGRGRPASLLAPSPPSPGAVSMDGGGRGEEEEDSLVQEETLCVLVKEVFGLSEERHLFYDDHIARGLGNKPPAKILVEELMGRLSLLQTNSHPYYRPPEFETRNAYDLWQQQEGQRISTLINQFWRAPLPNLDPLLCKATYWASMHDMYRDLMVLLIKHDKLLKAGPTTGGLLLSSSRRLLREFSLHYGVGEVFRRIVYLDHLASTGMFEGDEWYLRHCSVTVTGIQDLLTKHQARVTMVRTEFEVLSRSLDQLKQGCCFLTERLLQEKCPQSKVVCLITLLRDIQALSGTLLGCDQGDLETIITQSLKESVQNSYNGQKLRLTTELRLNSYSTPVSPELINKLIVHIQSEIQFCQDNYQQLFNIYHVEIMESAASIFYSCLMADVSVLCEKALSAQQESEEMRKGIDPEMVAMARRLDRLDQEWTRFIPNMTQEWRVFVSRLAVQWFQQLIRDVQAMIVYSVARDKFQAVSLNFSKKDDNDESQNCLNSLSHASPLTQSIGSAFASVVPREQQHQQQQHQQHQQQHEDEESLINNNNRLTKPDTSRPHSSAHTGISFNPSGVLNFNRPIRNQSFPHLGALLSTGEASLATGETRFGRSASMSRMQSDEPNAAQRTGNVVTRTHEMHHEALQVQGTQSKMPRTKETKILASETPETHSRRTPDHGVQSEMPGFGSSGAFRPVQMLDKQGTVPSSNVSSEQSFTKPSRDAASSTSSTEFTPVHSSAGPTGSTGTPVLPQSFRPVATGNAEELASAKLLYHWTFQEDHSGFDRDHSTDSAPMPQRPSARHLPRRTVQDGNALDVGSSEDWPRSRGRAQRRSFPSVSSDEESGPEASSEVGRGGDIAGERLRAMFEQLGILPGDGLSPHNLDDTTDPVTDVELPISCSLVDAVYVIRQACALMQDIFELLKPEAVSIAGGVRGQRSLEHLPLDLQQLMMSPLQAVTFAVRLFGSNMLSMDLCATAFKDVSRLINREVLSRVFIAQNAGLLSSCRHERSGLPDCNVYFNRNAACLCDNFEPVNPEMCLRINNVQGLSELLPDLIPNVDPRNALAPGGPMDPGAALVGGAGDAGDAWSEQTYRPLQQYLQGLMAGQIRLLAFRVNLMLSQALRVLLQLEMGAYSITNRLHPLVTCIHNHLVAMATWLYPQCYQMFCLELWKCMVKDFEMLVEDLLTEKTENQKQAMLLLQAVAHLMETMTNHEEHGLTADAFLEPADGMIQVLQLYTWPTTRLVSLYQGLLNKVWEGQSEDSWPLRLEMLKSLQRLLCQQKKCFTGNELLRALIKSQDGGNRPENIWEWAHDTAEKLLGSGLVRQMTAGGHTLDLSTLDHSDGLHYHRDGYGDHMELSDDGGYYFPKVTLHSIPRTSRNVAHRESPTSEDTEGSYAPVARRLDMLERSKRRDGEKEEEDEMNSERVGDIVGQPQSERLAAFDTEVEDIVSRTLQTIIAEVYNDPRLPPPEGRELSPEDNSSRGELKKEEDVSGLISKEKTDLPCAAVLEKSSSLENTDRSMESAKEQNAEHSLDPCAQELGETKNSPRRTNSESETVSSSRSGTNSSETVDRSEESKSDPSAECSLEPGPKETVVTKSKPYMENSEAEAASAPAQPEYSMSAVLDQQRKMRPPQTHRFSSYATDTSISDGSEYEFIPTPRTLSPAATAGLWGRDSHPVPFVADSQQLYCFSHIYDPIAEEGEGMGEDNVTSRGPSSKFFQRTLDTLDTSYTPKLLVTIIGSRHDRPSKDFINQLGDESLIVREASCIKRLCRACFRP